MSEQASQLSEYLRTHVKSHMSGPFNVESLRMQEEAMLSSQASASADVQIESIQLGGIPTEHLSTSTSLPNTAILYLHGGGWCTGSPQGVRSVTWRLTTLTNVSVYVPQYRLAPEHPYPAGLDDCVQTYMALLEQGIPASSIVVAGDSAGGDLTFALALRLKAAHTPQPAALVGISPNTDLTYSGDSFNANADSDVLLTQNFLHWIVKTYTAQSDLTNPFISPLYGDVASLPPTYLLVSATEMLLDDSTRLAEKMQKAGVEVVLDIWPELWHDWVMMADQIPEGELALEKIAAFIKTCMQK
jgi:epsilon-lactone hydrolase